MVENYITQKRYSRIKYIFFTNTYMWRFII